MKLVQVVLIKYCDNGTYGQRIYSYSVAWFYVSTPCFPDDDIHQVAIKRGVQVAFTMPCNFSKLVLSHSLLHCHHLQVTLSDLICIISPPHYFSVVRSQMAKDDLSYKLTKPESFVQFEPRYRWGLLVFFSF